MRDGDAGGDREAHEALELVVAAVRRADDGRRGRTTDTGQSEDAAADSALAGLAALHDLRGHLLDWEPLLIEAARRSGVSWARLAPALGVTSRQAAERRYLRLRPSPDDQLTREQRVQATRDERAGDRAVAEWARENASELRQIAGQVSAVTGLSNAGRRRARRLTGSLTDDDPSTLIAPLAEMHEHLVEDHATLADVVDAVGQRVARVRRETQRRRDART